MFECVDCGHRGEVFHGVVAGRDQGAFIYRAKCPKCGGVNVNVLEGPREKDIRIEV